MADSTWENTYPEIVPLRCRIKLSDVNMFIKDIFPRGILDMSGLTNQWNEELPIVETTLQDFVDSIAETESESEAEDEEPNPSVVRFKQVQQRQIDLEEFYIRTLRDFYVAAFSYLVGYEKVLPSMALTRRVMLGVNVCGFRIERCEEYIQEVSQKVAEFEKSNILDGCALHIMEEDRNDMPVVVRRYVFRPIGSFSASSYDLPDDQKLKEARDSIYNRFKNILLRIKKKTKHTPSSHNSNPSWSITIGVKESVMTALKELNVGPLGPFCGDPTTLYFPFKRTEKISEVFKLGLLLTWRWLDVLKESNFPDHLREEVKAYNEKRLQEQELAPSENTTKNLLPYEKWAYTGFQVEDDMQWRIAAVNTSITPIHSGFDDGDENFLLILKIDYRKPRNPKVFKRLHQPNVSGTPEKTVPVVIHENPEPKCTSILKSRLKPTGERNPKKKMRFGKPQIFYFKS